MAGAIIIGETANYNTWLSLRSVFAPASVTNGINRNREFYTAAAVYPDGAFKSASSGYGLIKADTVTLAGDTTANFWVVTPNIMPLPDPPPYYIFDLGIQLNWINLGQSQVPNEVRDVLIGKTVTMEDATTFTINADLFDPATGGVQVYAFDQTDSPGSVASVETLTPII